MTDNLKDAPVPGEQGEQEVPIPGGSGGSSGKGSESSGLDVDALVEQLKTALQPVIAESVDARFKSGKDKRFDQLDKLIQKAGGDPERIRTDLEIQEMQRRLDEMTSGQGNISGKVAPQEAPKAGNEDAQKKTTEYLSKIKEEYGVVPSNEELSEIVSSNPGISLDQYFVMIENQALKKARQSNPGPGMVSMPPSEAEIKTLEEQYQAEAKEIVGNPSALIELKRQYREKGLDIW